MDQIKIKRQMIGLAAAVFMLFVRSSQAALPDIHGFLEFDVGVRTRDDNTKRDDFNLLEQRLQLKSLYYFEG